MLLNLASLKEFRTNLAEGRIYFLIDIFLNNRRAWRYRVPTLVSTKTATVESTSLSDEYVYSHFCGVASLDNSVYEKFRSCSQYKQILEHVSRSLGQQYLDMIITANNLSLKLVDLLADDIGSPFRYTYPGIGRVSPTQLRYAKVLSDLIDFFGSLNNFTIAEVGVGYGGQASQICKSFDISKYELADIPTVLQLASRYIEDRVPNAPLKLLEIESHTGGMYDLFISNYAFSELKRDVQEQYFRNYVSKAKRGYVIYNDITPPEWGSMNAEEFASRIPGASIYSEQPKTGMKNQLIVWGHGNSNQVHF